MSARRSCVDGPAGVPLEGGVAELSSPIKSTIESLSVRVDPTGLRSLTASVSFAVIVDLLAYQCPSSSP